MNSAQLLFGTLAALGTLAGCNGDTGNSGGAGTTASATSTTSSTSSTSSTSATSSSGAGGATAGVVWKDDGVQNSADGSAQSLVAGGIIGFALNVGDLAHGNNLSVNVTTATPADWKPGTFVCPSPAALGYVHSPNGGVTYQMATCSVTVTQTSPTLKGTFDATFTISTGGTKTLSEGAFDVPLTQ